MSDQPLSHREPIVPERDEPVARPERSGKGGKKKARARSRSGSGGGFWKFLILLLIVAVAGLGYFGYEQHRILSQRLAVLQANFDQVNGKLDSTDESLSQSGAALSLKLKEHTETLDKHWSEIRKLWGVSNDRNKQAIAANEEAIAEVKKAIKGVKNSTLARKKEMAALRQTVEKDMVELNRAVESAASAALATKLEVEETLGSNQAMVDRLNRMESSLKRWRQEINGKVAGNQEAINSIDAYRRSTNQQILQIKQQLGGQ